MLIMDERTNSTLEVRLRAGNAVLRGRSMSDVADAFGTNVQLLVVGYLDFNRKGTTVLKVDLPVVAQGNLKS